MQWGLAWRPHASVRAAQKHIFQGSKIVYQVCQSLFEGATYLNPLPFKPGSKVKDGAQQGG